MGLPFQGVSQFANFLGGCKIFLGGAKYFWRVQTILGGGGFPHAPPKKSVYLDHVFGYMHLCAPFCCLDMH